MYVIGTNGLSYTGTAGVPRVSRESIGFIRLVSGSQTPYSTEPKKNPSLNNQLTSVTGQ